MPFCSSGAALWNSLTGGGLAATKSRTLAGGGLTGGARCDEVRTESCVMNARVLSLSLCSAFFALTAGVSVGAAELARDGNRLAYLQELEPFYVGGNFPKLTTPQWIGDTNVEAAVTLGIDDMRATQPYETFLRPLLERLKKIDGRAPVSIFSVAPTPDDPQLQRWVKEGVSFEVHTLTHPCPILAKSNFTAAADIFYGCIDLLSTIPGNKPVAFRTPCCDSINSASPRLFTELMSKTGPGGKFVTMDSSVVMLFTTNDTSLAAGDLVDAQGRARFMKYVPFPSFKTTIENYPYPYAINHVLWEMPFVAPSDWESFHIQGNLSAQMLEDWERALDIIVRKRGIFNFVFHPHGWSGTNQMVEFVDYVERKHAGKVKFLNYPETQERINKNMLAGQALKTAAGEDNGVRLVDLNGDGFLDVVIGNAQMRRTRLWSEATRTWIEGDFPAELVTANARDNGARFGIAQDGAVCLIVANERERGAWIFDGSAWKENRGLLTGLDGIVFADGGRDRGARLRDVDGDGVCELIVANEAQNILLQWDGALRKWGPMGFTLPAGVAIVNRAGQDNGVRFVDVNEDGHDDVVFSNEDRYGLWIYLPQLYLGFARGWSREVSNGPRSDAEAIPAFVRAGPNRNNGAWFHSQTLWVQNEDTAHRPDLVERRTFGELLVGSKPEPKSPEGALKSFALDPNFQIEIVAAEPLVVDPVNFEWDAQGRLWVVEMRDYPMGIDGKGKAGGVVKFLTDTDGDGKYDKATDFLTGVNFPTGVMPWRNGVLVSAAPDIFFATDDSGDGVADQRKVLITGFAPGNQQHRVNGFAFGMDGWVYCANGESGGTMKAVDGVLNKTGAPAQPIRFRGDMRFHPDNGEFQSIEGTTQFGRRRDDWDNWFGNNNPNWLWHYYLPSRYVERNPTLRIADLRVEMPENNILYPAGKTQQRFNDIGKGKTASAANSATPYRDELFGAEFANSIFISDPSFNMIHREVVEADGVSFKSHRAANEADHEFLASRDTWFRPTTIKIGPDGALYIADMYRFVIEHPEWIPADVQKNMNLRAGEDKGRIYRVFPKGATLRAIPNLAALETPKLIAALDHANGWQRDTAQQLLMWRRDPAAPELLRKLLATTGRSVTRAQALWTLYNLGELRPTDAIAALKDSDPRVRAQALRVSETLKTPDVAAAAAALATDSDPRVLFQLALSLGEWNGPDASRALAALWRRRAGDAHFRDATLSSAPAHLVGLLEDLAKFPPANAAETKMAGEFFALVPQSDTAIASALAVLGANTGAWRFGALGRMMDAYARGKGPGAEVRAAVERLTPQARAVALNANESEADRIEALRLLGTNDLGPLQQLLAPNVPSNLQRAALNQIAKTRAATVADIFVNTWQTAGPALRLEILNLFFSRPEWIERLLSALERSELPANVIDAPHQQTLRKHASGAIAARAKKIFAATDANRVATITKYESAKSLRGDASTGAALFRQTCASCHRFRDEGSALGPDLGSVAEKPADYLLSAILDPNQAVEARYLSYTVTMKDGAEFSGIISSETANSVTLSAANDQKNTLLRADIKDLKSNGKSLMPEGLESGLTPQAMADLLAYLRSNIRPKSFAGNAPRMMQPSTDGTIHLSASNAEIFGDTLVFEGNFRNLGFWESESDRARWVARLPKDGAYDLYLNYALPEETKANRIRIQAGRGEISAAIPATEAWEKYKIAKVGRVDFGAGDQTIIVSGQKPFRGPLLDLREVILVPAGQPAPPQP